MRRISKRWEPPKPVLSGTLFRAFLSEVKTHEHAVPFAWACIECSNLSGPFRLEIWDSLEDVWDEIGIFPTLKQAKAVGRLLAGVALAKNI